MFALYQEPFIVPQEAGADWQVLKPFLFFDLLCVPFFLLEVTVLKVTVSVSVPLFAFLSVCVSLSLLSTCLLLPLSPFLFYAVSGLLIFSSYEHSWGNFSVLMALATTSNQKTGGSKAIVSSAKFHASHFPMSTGISPFVHHYKRYLTNSKYMP